MLRKITCLGLIALILSAAPASAEPPAKHTTPAKAAASSGSKRALWTVAGIGAGFAAGLFVGLNAFDDSINSDQKVWTSALVAAAAGGVAGNLLAKTLNRPAPVRVDSAGRGSLDLPNVSWRAAASSPDGGLRRRVREVSARGTF